MDTETDGLLLDDVGTLKRAVEEEATQVGRGPDPAHCGPVESTASPATFQTFRGSSSGLVDLLPAAPRGHFLS